ncbi:MAG: cation diffusion facilitator family transporter [Candidatus Aenigmatarchaeota archaeon]
MIVEKPKKTSNKLHAALFSIKANSFLIILKAVVAVITGSIAIIAELAHSLFDMFASILAYVGIKKAEKAEDSCHPYGHERYENISALAQTILIVVTSIFVMYEAVIRLFEPKPVSSLEIGLVVMIVIIGIDYFVSRYLHKASKDYGSSALEADAYHFTTDLWGAISVVIGLVFVILGFPIFDSIAAIAVAVLMLVISYKLGKGAINVLLDKSPCEDVMKKIEAAILSVKKVKSFHKLKARYMGNKILVDLHIHVSPMISVAEGHSISHELKKKLKQKVPEIKDVIVHVEPIDS